MYMLDGVTGVFDIDQLVELLERDKAKNIFVASVPKEYAYVDYIIVATGNSQKHMKALATFVRKVYKLKRYENELIPKIEGEKSKDWMALDLGNVFFELGNYVLCFNNLQFSIYIVIATSFQSISNKIIYISYNYIQVYNYILVCINLHKCVFNYFLTFYLEI